MFSAGWLETIKAREPTIPPRAGRYRWIYVDRDSSGTSHKRIKNRWKTYAPAPEIVYTGREVVLNNNTPPQI